MGEQEKNWPEVLALGTNVLDVCDNTQLQVGKTFVMRHDNRQPRKKEQEKSGATKQADKQILGLEKKKKALELSLKLRL